MTAPRGEPNYNAVVERAYHVLENMGFSMIFHAKKPRSWWHWAFEWAKYILNRYQNFWMHLLCTGFTFRA